MSGTHFGFQTVDETQKATRVRGVFDSVASKYDVMNDLMSLGLHRAWKAYTVAVANLREGQSVLESLTCETCGAALLDCSSVDSAREVLQLAALSGAAASPHPAARRRRPREAAARGSQR